MGDKELELSQQSKLFIHGFTSVLICKSDDEEVELLKQGLDYLELKDGRVVVFRSSSNKDIFVRFSIAMGAIDNELNILDEHRFNKLMGYCLELPPNAIDWYIDNWREEDAVLINYHGLEVVCHKDDKDTCINWLLEKKPIPADLKTEIYGVNLRDKEVVFRIAS